MVCNLLHIHRCVKPARLFTNRILQTLREAPVCGFIRLSESFFKDINWFVKFLEVFNGSVEIHSYYAIPIHPSLSSMSIVHLEAANVLVALRCWAESLRNSQRKKELKLQPSQPLFSYRQDGQLFTLTAYKARYLLSEAICKCGLSPKDFGFHAFRHSGASLAFDLQIPLENIKSHGSWKSEAV